MTRTALKVGQELHGAKSTYHIESVLGHGSFGITYLASTKLMMEGSLGRIETTVKVAIKEFFMCDFNSRSQDGSNVERTSSNLVGNYLTKFQREAENLSKLNHPNIVRVLEVFDEHNTTYYVMEYIDGESLDSYIKKNGKLSEKESLSIIKEICSALSYMHANKMLHLDLKPKNIMRRKDGRIFIIDFGLAKQYDENGEPESSTTLGMGTPGYAPIEQIYYKKGGSFPVTLDIYALGATLYKMLTGKTPPDSSYILNEGLSMEPLKQANVSNNVISIVENAMAPLKKDRTPSIDAFAQAIKNVSDNEAATDGTLIDEIVESNPTNIREELPTDKKQSAVLTKTKKILSTAKYIVLGLLLIVISAVVTYMFTKSNNENGIDKDNEVSEEIEFDNHDKTITVNGISFIMKPVIGGSFQMGATPEQGTDVSTSELPVHLVTLSSFYIGQTEVTQDLWESVMGNNPSYSQGDGKLPVEKVSWKTAQQFIAKLNQLTGEQFRLPTEAEWEYAARGGNLSKNYKYSGSNTLDKVAWFNENSENITHIVAKKKPNELGLYDMSGNVWELCQDIKGQYESAESNNPLNTTGGTERVVRGGSLYDNSKSCRISARFSINPVIRNYNLGLRLVLPASTTPANVK